MRIIVQIFLLIAVVLISLVLMRGGTNARHMAVRRIILVLFGLLAAVSIFLPDILTLIARFLGVGRGTDLVLYALIVCVLLFISTTYQRFRQSENTLTKLARRIAIDETERPWEAVQQHDDGRGQTRRRL
jgi:hypothetical protein